MISQCFIFNDKSIKFNETNIKKSKSKKKSALNIECVSSLNLMSVSIEVVPTDVRTIL